MDALTGSTHRDALRVAALAGETGVTAVGLAAQLKATRAYTLSVLTQLEAQGLVRGTPAPGKRQSGGVPTVFRIQLPKVEAAIEELRAWILGADVPVRPARKTVVNEGGNPS
jgi:hypothetical protein